MKALISHFEKSPQWGDFAEPLPNSDERLVHVSAVALTNLVKGQSNGTHYSVQGDAFPFVPGGEGVGKLENGQRIFFFANRKPFGAMAEKTVIASDFYISLPDDLDDVSAAAIANPAMSSWAALTRRARIENGETVLINGATGVAGKMAIRIARHLGAGRIIATGRKEDSPENLLGYGADEILVLEDEFDKRVNSLMSEVSIVLDYLWGSSAQTIMAAAGNTHSEKTIRYVQIGAIAGNTVQMAASPFRSAGLILMGSGLGSVTDKDLLTCIGGALGVAKKIGLDVEATQIPMQNAPQVWLEQRSDRIVFVIGENQ
jgi:NADPH:quinone reductase-like Zn-dependent oxidoreductase